MNELNDLSYAYHYSSLDSTRLYATQAYELAADDYETGKAEALNNLAFVDIALMQYDAARNRLTTISEFTDNQIELLVADVQSMRLCQRISANREYYEYREKASKRMERINEDRNSLSERLRCRLVYAESEFAIINSTYYYYVGLQEQSAEALLEINPNGDILSDTAQYLNYLYNIGSGGIIHKTTDEATQREELEYLRRCLLLARESGSVYFEANAMMAMADLGEGIDLAGNALMMFSEYGDRYQTAAAHRTLASCLMASGDYNSAFLHLEKALSDSIVYQAPDLIGSIYQQLGHYYANIGDSIKAENYYETSIGIQNKTRQDRYYEAQAGMLDKSLNVLNFLIVAVLVAILILVILLRVLYLKSVKQERNMQTDVLLEPLKRWQEENQRLIDEQEQYREEIDERIAVAHNTLRKEGRTQMEHRSRLALINSVIPFIDRSINEVDSINLRRDENEEQTARRYEYIRELSDKIIEYNDVLTEWIRMSQGTLSLRIESFRLQDIFNIVDKGRAAFAVKGIDFEVLPTDLMIKADKVLTLFMINTMADNARKNTPEGGRVAVSAEDNDDYVEISITDNGRGLTDEELANIFSRTSYDGHGFGLMNCRGIIEKYKKTSKLFSRCALSAESTPGKGSRFFFRLPKGMMTKLAALLFVLLPVGDAFATDNTPDSLSSDHNRFEIVDFYDLSDDIAADSTLAEYCRVMQQAESDRTVAVVILLLLLLLILPAYYVLYYRHRLYYRFCLSRIDAINNILLDENTTKEKLELISNLSQDEYPQDLRNIVTNIVDTLREAERRFNSEQMTTEMAEDELTKLELESNNLHVANLVIDNCFSTLKHEPMSYPNRIKLLAEEGRTSIDHLQEVLTFYRELYFILSMQARGQVEHIKMSVKSLEISSLAVGIEGETTVLGNRSMLQYMFEILCNKLSLKNGFRAKAEAKDSDYVVIRIPLHSGCDNIFVPTQENIPFLICRQIVREHAEATNKFGCGIVVKKQMMVAETPLNNSSDHSDNNYILEIILPRS